MLFIVTILALMETLLQIPYFAPDSPLPMPTDADIDAAPDVSMEYGGRRIVAVGAHFVVKFGDGVNLIEGENMLFVRERTKVPVRRVYAPYSKARKNYVVMERIAGQTLSSLWPQLHVSEKESIVQKVRFYFDELRALPPPDYYGSLGRRILLDGIFWTQEQESAINGPFTSKEALTEALAIEIRPVERSTVMGVFQRQCLPRVFCNHRPTFTLGDYQRKNIIIHRLDNQSQRSDLPRWQIHILDWENSGWYPTCWNTLLPPVHYDGTTIGACGLRRCWTRTSQKQPGCKLSASSCGPNGSCWQNRNSCL